MKFGNQSGGRGAVYKVVGASPDIRAGFVNRAPTTLSIFITPFPLR